MSPGEIVMVSDRTPACSSTSGPATASTVTASANQIELRFVMKGFCARLMTSKAATIGAPMMGEYNLANTKSPTVLRAAKIHGFGNQPVRMP